MKKEQIDHIEQKVIFYWNAYNNCNDTMFNFYYSYFNQYSELLLEFKYN